MPSLYDTYTNKIKYADVDVNDGTWKSAKEVWVNNNGVWTEPKQVWVNDGGTWKRATNSVRWLTFDGSATYLATSTANAFNNYLSGGASYTYYRFMFTLAGSGVRTLFSYGNGSVSYFIIEIGTDNKVYVKSRFNSGTAYSVAHTTALTVGEYYQVNVSARQSTPNRLIINITDVNGATVGVDINSTSFVTFSTSSYAKFIGKNYGNTNYFSGRMYNFYLYGANYAETATISSADEYINSTVGATTIEGGTYDWTIYGGEVIEETG